MWWSITNTTIWILISQKSFWCKKKNRILEFKTSCLYCRVEYLMKCSQLKPSKFIIFLEGENQIQFEILFYFESPGPGVKNWKKPFLWDISSSINLIILKSEAYKVFTKYFLTSKCSQQHLEEKQNQAKLKLPKLYF